MKQKSFAVVGLGNPGSKYELTRHNVGFLFLDWLADRHKALFSASRFQGVAARAVIEGRNVRMLKPQTYMNLSGTSVVPFINYFDIDPVDMLVVHDDIDMHPGRIKLVSGGGTGGHNGIRSLVKELGTQDFFRLKIGIGRPGSGETHPDMEVDKYVLSRLSVFEIEQVEDCFARLDQGLAFLLSCETGRAMTLLNAIK
jgi:PTH1 family peptidyl-tRNA hydrolase